MKSVDGEGDVPLQEGTRITLNVDAARCTETYETT